MYHLVLSNLNVLQYVPQVVQLFKDKKLEGTCVAQVVKGPALAFSLGHGLRFVGLSPVSGSIIKVESAGD